MAEIVEDRVKETTTSTGTGNITLAGAMVGYKAFADVCQLGDTFYGAIVATDPSGVPQGDWEIGYYTYIAANTIERTFVNSSSNNDGLVNFAAGTKQVFIEFTAEQVKKINVIGTDAAVMPTVPDTSIYTSICFQEEFSGSVVDTTKFNTKLWYGVDDAIKNFNVENGSLNIWPAKGSDGLYQKRALDTDGKYYQRYGFFEIEAMLPVGYGIIPGFWLLNHDDAVLRPEISIMQAYPGGANNNAPEWGNAQNQPTNYRAFVYDGTMLGTNTLATLLGSRTDLHTKFHKYGVHWSPTEVKFYFDGQQLGATINIANNPRMQDRMYMILSMWIGSFSGNPDSVPMGVSPPSDNDPRNAFRISYMRAWRIQGIQMQNDETPPLTVTDPGEPTPPQNPVYIDYHGDSTIWGSDGAAMNDGATRVAKPAPVTFGENLPTAPPYIVRNEGVSGNTMGKLLNGTDTVHAAWSTLMATTNARYVIINCCINDTYVPGNTPATYTSQLNQLIDIARANNKTVILETPNETDDSSVDAYRTAMMQVAVNKQCALIDQYNYLRDHRIANSLTIYQMCPDGYHPNQTTYTLKGTFAAQRFTEITTGNPTTNKLIEYYGSSIIWGWDGAGQDGPNGWPRVATPAPTTFDTQVTGFVVSNKGGPGWLAENALQGTAGLAPWSAVMAASTAEWVILEYHSHDSIANCTTRIRQLIVTAKAHGKKVIIETVGPGMHEGNLSYQQISQAQRDAAAAENVQVIDQTMYLDGYMLANGLTLTDICPDTQHPNQATYTLKGSYAAQRFAQILAGTVTPSPVPDPGPGPGPSPGPSPTRAIRGPDPSLFGATPTFFDDFDTNTVGTRWNDGIWYYGPNPPNTWRIRNSCLEMCVQPDSMFTGHNDTGYCVIDTDPDSKISGGFAQTFGFLQAEIKCPIGRGLWPAFWWFGHPGSKRPEIDIFEGYPGGDSGSGGWSTTDRAPHPKRLDGTVHTLNTSDQYEAGYHNFNWGERDYSARFYTFGCLWDRDRMEFYLDGQLVRRITDATMMAWFAQFRLYIMCQLGVNYMTAGGPSSDPSITPTGFGSDPNNPPANVMRFSYVSCWQFKKYGG